MNSLIKILPLLLLPVVIAGAPLQQQSPEAAAEQAFLKLIFDDLAPKFTARF